MRTGQAVDIHDFAPEDPRWRDYIHAMHQLARLAAPEVVSAIPLPRGAKHVLDLGGAHGWFSAELCQRHDAFAVTDEIYEHIYYAGEHIPMATLPGMADRTITISGASKTFSVIETNV